MDEASGSVYVRTGFQGNIISSGNVNIPGNIQVYSTPEDPVHTHITEVGTTGILDVPYMPIDGNVVVTSGNINATVSGNVVVTSGNVNAVKNPKLDKKDIVWLYNNTGVHKDSVKIDNK